MILWCTHKKIPKIAKFPWSKTLPRQREALTWFALLICFLSPANAMVLSCRCFLESRANRLWLQQKRKRDCQTRLKSKLFEGKQFSRRKQTRWKIGRKKPEFMITPTVGRSPMVNGMIFNAIDRVYFPASWLVADVIPGDVVSLRVCLACTTVISRA